MIGLSTVSDDRMREQTKTIYDVLIRCGYPGLLNTNMAKDQSQMGEILSEYLQPTPKREGLIEWLVMQLCPLYQPQAHKNEKKGGKVKRLLVWLWKLGVLPYSKHTRNLDYEKYVEGLIGLENAIGLLFNLTTLLLQSRRAVKSRQDNQFHFFLEEVFRNYDSLINVDYDPYNISFPPAYQQLTQQEFQQKYAELLIKIEKLKSGGAGKEGNGDGQAKFERMFADFQAHKGEFLSEYEKLAVKMRKTIEDNQSMVGACRQEGQYQGRTIAVSPQLPSLYRRYKEKTKLAAYPLSEVGGEAKLIHELITSLNSTVPL